MAKGIIKNYSFNTAAKTITLTDITTVRLDKLALITDVTTNKILYNFADVSVATATVATNVITLSTLQGGENNTDKLRIDYDIESSDTSAFADTIQPVSASSLPLPTGASTLAEQQTQTTSLQLIDDIVATDDTSTHATGTTKGAVIMAAATPTDASVNANDLGAVAMTVDRKLHVSVQDALPAGTNAIGKLAANSGVDIGDVDITSIIPGTGATNLGKAEDAAHASGDTGVFMLSVRNDNATTTFAADGDYQPIATDLKGRVSVRQISSTATLSNVSGSATSVTVLAANSARVGATVYNDSTAICYLKFGATASTTSFTVKLAADTYYEVPGGYTGVIDGIWASATGSARVTELT